MTVASTNSKTQANGNGITANFPFAFKYFAKADIEVIVTSAASVDSVKTLGLHYDIALSFGDTGTIVFESVPPNDHRPQTGEVVTIRRIMALTQPTDYIPGGGISTSTIEATDDRQLMQIQQMQEQINRAPKLKDTTTLASVTLPDPAANGIIGWNAGATDLENKAAADIDLTAVSAFIATLLDDADAATARTTLGAEESGAAAAAIAAHEAEGDPHPQYLTSAEADALFLTPAEGNAAYQPLDADILFANVTDTLIAGFNATEFDAGTKTTGTFTPDPASGNFQKAVNGGAHTLAPPGSTCSIVLQITNNGSAGAITTSGFTKVDGSFTTTSGHDFVCYILRNNGFSHLNIVALQ